MYHLHKQQFLLPEAKTKPLKNVHFTHNFTISLSSPPHPIRPSSNTPSANLFVLELLVLCCQFFIHPSTPSRSGGDVNISKKEIETSPSQPLLLTVGHFAP